MKLLTAEQKQKLLENGQINAAHVARDGKTEDFAPVVKLLCPWGAATVDLAHAIDASVPLGERVGEIWADAAHKVGARVDQTEIVRLWEDAGGVKL